MSLLNTLNPFGSAGPPLTNYHFRVDFGLPGLFVKDVGFNKVSGISMELALKEVEIGGIDGGSVDVPNGYKFDDLVLERGMITGSYLINWMEAQLLTQMKVPIPIIVTMLDEYHLPIYSWFFINAYPIKFETGEFNSTASGESAIMIEKITFRYFFYKQVNMSYLSAALKAAMNAVS